MLLRYWRPTSVARSHVVAGFLLRDFDLATGHQPGAKCDVAHFLDQLFEIVTRPRANEELGRSVFRHDVRGVATVRDDAVDADIHA